jgi:hypothetical protein
VTTGSTRRVAVSRVSVQDHGHYRTSEFQVVLQSEHNERKAVVAEGLSLETCNCANDLGKNVTENDIAEQSAEKRTDSVVQTKERKVKMASQRQVMANRSNAQKSTGPKNTSLTKLNALKHGILSKEVLLKGEKKSDLEELGRKLRQELSPQGELELFLVDRIVSSIWRLKRALRIESTLMSYEYDQGLNDKWNNQTGDERYASKRMVVGKDSQILQRYETTIERQIYRALHELIRLQSARKGETPPAPIAVDVDVNRE